MISFLAQGVGHADDVLFHGRVMLAAVGEQDEGEAAISRVPFDQLRLGERTGPGRASFDAGVREHQRIGRGHEGDVVVQQVVSPFQLGDDGRVPIRFKAKG